jgi:CRISPR-associated protein Csb2
MLALEVEFLTGRCVATERHDRSVAEWPPHPTRLFSALAAAHFETKTAPDSESEMEGQQRDALEWLEGLDPPSICASDVSCRTVVTAFVPVNDSNDALIKRGKKITIFAKIDEGIELRRNRQERYFPTMIPFDPVIVYSWPDAAPEEVARHGSALERLAANVTYLGHSSSLVRVSVCDGPLDFTLRPAQTGEDSDAVMRVPGPKRLEALRDAYDLSLAVNRRIEPPEGAFRGYVRTDGTGEPLAPSTVFDDRLIVFRRTKGRRLPLHASLLVTSRVREALMKLAHDPTEVLSGHIPRATASRNETGNSTAPTQRPHVAIVPLANVGHRFSDGSLMGFAVVLPRSLQELGCREERRTVLKAVAHLTELYLGDAGRWLVERVGAGGRQKAFQPERYCDPARCWASMTPVVFGKFPKRLQSAEAEQMVREHCRMIGLPDPVHVAIASVSPILGVPPGSYFPTLSTRGKPVGTVFVGGRHRIPPTAPDQPQPRLRSHVIVEFAKPVRGPVILGAGRYLGMGFCLPCSGGRPTGG